MKVKIIQTTGWTLDSVHYKCNDEADIPKDVYEALKDAKIFVVVVEQKPKETKQ